MSELQSSTAMRVWAWLVGIAGAILIAIVIGPALFYAFGASPVGDAGLSEQAQADLLAQCGNSLAEYIHSQIRSQICVDQMRFLRNQDNTVNYSLMGGVARVYEYFMGDQKWVWFTFRCRVAQNGAVMLDQTGSVFPNGAPPRACDVVY